MTADRRAETSKPVIVVAGRSVAAGGIVGWPKLDALAVPRPYIDAMRAAGGVEAVVLPRTDGSVSTVLLSRFDGLLLIGGPDIDPKRYGCSRHPSVYGVDPARDEFEVQLIRQAMAAGMPVLAICRGMQLLNVAFGGTLIQHLHRSSPTAELPGGHGDPHRAEPVLHDVDIAADSRLAGAAGARRISVSSLHHQAIDLLGTGMRPVATARDGVIEAVEMAEGWTVGLQWHPETTAASDPTQAAIFAAFASHAAEWRTRTGNPPKP